MKGKPLERKSREWYRKTKREVRADPRIYDADPRYPMYVLAIMYGVTAKCMCNWKHEFCGDI